MEKSDILNICLKCGANSTLRCSRCLDFYCSSKCRDEDWAHHRYTCFLKPDLIGLESSVEKKQCGSGSVMGANAEVVIKHIEEDGVFWVMLHERTEKFNSLVIDLEQHYKEINGKTEESHTLVLGQIVLVAEHSTFFRGEIIDFQAEYIKLRLIDVGKVLTKALSDAKNAPSKFLSIDPFTFPIKLPQKAKTLEVGDKVKIKYSGLNIKQADLALENIQVRQYMIDSSPTKESTSYITKAIKYNEERCLIGSIIYCSKFPLRTPIKVRVVDFSQLLLNQVITGYLEDRQNHIHYRELRKNIQEYCEQDNLDTNYLPIEGEYILAIFKGIYYRALCLEVLEDENKTMRNFKVQFIDFGNVTKVKKDIIKLPSILLKHPCIAYLCYVQNFKLEKSAGIDATKKYMCMEAVKNSGDVFIVNIDAFN